MSKITGKVTYKEVLKGDTGYTFEPHVTVDGVLYWTNNGNLPNPTPKNVKGEIGNTPNLQIGEIETLESDENAYVNITGTSEEPILNMGIPRGKDYTNLINNINYSFSFNEYKNIINFKRGFYTKSGEWYTNDVYTTIEISVKDDETYSCTTNVGSKTLSIVNLWSNNKFVKSIGGGEIGEHNDYIFTIPKGINKITITNLGLEKPILKQIKFNYNLIRKLFSLVVKINDNNIIVCKKYDNNFDLRIYFEPVGANDFYQIGKICKVVNDSEIVSDNFNLNEILIQDKLTDSFSPYMLEAINNADGDKIEVSKYEFVGGAHSYNNTLIGARTGTNIKRSVKVDNIHVSNGVYRCNEIKINLINRIQGNNTKKHDGTGREILEENLSILIDKEKIKVINKIKALEDLIIKRYYGLQFYFYGYNNGNIYYITDNKYTPYSLLNNSNSGSISEGSNCNNLQIYNDDDLIEIGINKIGLGLMKSITNDIPLAFTSNNKVYFNIINNKNVNLKNNDILYLEGYYKFERNEKDVK